MAETKSIEQLNQGNQEILDKVHQYRGSKALIFDLDSTSEDIFGQQKFTAFNSHYGTIGYHPMVCFEGVTGDFMKAKLRSGNVYTSNVVVDFVEPLIMHYNEKFPEITPFLRGDSSFAIPALYELCEKQSVYYVIHLKSNTNSNDKNKAY